MDYNPQNVEFSVDGSGGGDTVTPTHSPWLDSLPAPPERVMSVRMQGNSGARVQPRLPPQLFGQFQVQARVTGARGAVTAFYVSRFCLGCGVVQRADGVGEGGGTPVPTRNTVYTPT